MKNKQKNDSPKKKSVISKLTIATIFIDLMIIIFLVVVYGPSSSFKNWFVTTALATGNHKYYANVLYSKDDIREVLKNNTVIETTGDTNTNEITFDDTIKDTYSSIYEEQILKRDKGNDLYKVIEINEKDYSGYIVAIYDSTRISLYTSSKINYGAQPLTEMVKESGALVAINASGFGYRGSSLLPTGTVIKDGKIFSIGSVNRHGGGLIGFNKNGVLMLTSSSAQTAIKNGMIDGMSFGPFLIVNGESAQVTGNGGWGYANRTAIAQRKDGIVLFLVVDGRGANGSNGISIADMIKLLEKYEAYNAANLDGGGSSTLVVDGKLINSPRGYGYTGERRIPNSWMLK